MPQEEEPSGWRRSVVTAEGVIPHPAAIVTGGPPPGLSSARCCLGSASGAPAAPAASCPLPGNHASTGHRRGGRDAAAGRPPAAGHPPVDGAIAPDCRCAGGSRLLQLRLGAKHGLAVAAVMATLTGAFGALTGRLLYGERLRAAQLIGVVLIVAGVATLSALRPG